MAAHLSLITMKFILQIYLARWSSLWYLERIVHVRKLSWVKERWIRFGWQPQLLSWIPVNLALNIYSFMQTWFKDNRHDEKVGGGCERKYAHEPQASWSLAEVFSTTKYVVLFDVTYHSLRLWRWLQYLCTLQNTPIAHSRADRCCPCHWCYFRCYFDCLFVSISGYSCKGNIARMGKYKRENRGTSLQFFPSPSVQSFRSFPCSINHKLAQSMLVQVRNFPEVRHTTHNWHDYRPLQVGTVCMAVQLSSLCGTYLRMTGSNHFFEASFMNATLTQLWSFQGWFPIAFRREHFTTFASHGDLLVISNDIVTVMVLASDCFV